MAAIVDPHHHLWYRAGERYLLAELRRDLDTVPGIETTVFIECGWSYRTEGPEAFRPIGETEAVVAADPDASIAGIVGHADLRDPGVADVLAAHVEAGAGRFRGIRHSAAFDESPDIHRSRAGAVPGMLGDPAFRSGLAAVGAAGLSFDTYLYHPQLPELTALARVHDDVVIVLDHLGTPLTAGPYAGRRDEVLAAWRTAMVDVAACPNVVLKVGGVGMPWMAVRPPSADTAETAESLAAAWGDDIRWCIELFGADRCMFESNFPVDKASCSYRTLWDAFALIVSEASATDRAALFGDTARRVYR
ncbi:MAG: amidohydrolase family protein, partial [Ilumatobacteraceae bacterium]